MSKLKNWLVVVKTVTTQRGSIVAHTRDEATEEMRLAIYRDLDLTDVYGLSSTEVVTFEVSYTPPLSKEEGEPS